MRQLIFQSRPEVDCSFICFCFIGLSGHGEIVVHRKRQ